jgi:transcriptional regulator
MYIPTQFKSDDVAAAIELMRKHSFATLICNDDDGQPFVTYLPLHVDVGERDGQPWPTLLGHVARANPHWKYLRDRGTALVSYLGPHSYMSPIDDNEPSYLAQWRSQSEEYHSKMVAMIVGFEMEITELQCKLKLNQHRPESHAALRRTFATGSEDERELLGWMDRLKM